MQAKLVRWWFLLQDSELCWTFMGNKLAEANNTRLCNLRFRFGDDEIIVGHHDISTVALFLPSIGELCVIIKVHSRSFRFPILTVTVVVKAMPSFIFNCLFNR